MRGACACCVAAACAQAVRFDFFGMRLPAGAMQRCVAGCGALPGCLLLECWHGGALLHDEWGTGNGKALLVVSPIVGAKGRKGGGGSGVRGSGAASAPEDYCCAVRGVLTAESAERAEGLGRTLGRRVSSRY